MYDSYALVTKLFIWEKLKMTVPGINKIIGIYHADGGVLGELKYKVGTFFGGSHCALCDITHTKTGKKDIWRKCEQKLGIPISFVHLNERNEKLMDYTKGNTPCIVGKTSTNYVMLATKKELEECNGNATALAELLEKKL